MWRGVGGGCGAGVVGGGGSLCGVLWGVVVLGLK